MTINPAANFQKTAPRFRRTKSDPGGGRSPAGGYGPR